MVRRRLWALTLLPLSACWLGSPRRRGAIPRPAVQNSASTTVDGPIEAVGRWWNETYEFFDALEIWNAPSLKEDKRPEAVELHDLVERMLDLTNGTKPKTSAEAKAAAKDESSKQEVSRILELLPAATIAYYRMRFVSVFEKPPVKRGLSSTAVYANLALLAVFARVVAPRLLAADNLDEFFEAVQPLGVPDRASLMGILQSIADYDTGLKILLYVAIFIVEKLFMLTEFLPIQIILKTLAPIIFGGLVQGALASAATETLAACCNFLIGRNFLKDQLEGFSIFGSEPLGKAEWFGKLQKAAKEDGLRLALLLRLSPVLPIPFDSYWYLLGALPLALPDFAIAHFAACLKTAFLDASFGMLLLTSVGNDGSVVQTQAQQIVLAATKAVADAVEDLGFGLYQLVGAEMLIMGSITSLLHRHWDLDPVIRGGMVSIVFIGFSVGNFLSGQIGDRFGRRASILVSYAMIAIFGFATACSGGPALMLFLRFFVGAGCGIGFPAAYSLMPEVAPSTWRSSLSTLMIGFMPLGELIGALVVLLVDPELDNSARGCSASSYYPVRALQEPELCAWRTLCEMSAIPAFFFLVLASRFLDESPQFLASCGRYEECEQVLQRMALLNGSQLNVEKLRAAFASEAAPGEVSPLSPKRNYSFLSAVNLLWANYLKVAAFMCLAHVAKDFSVFGLSYMLPQYFAFLKGLVAGVELLVVATLALPGVVLTYLCSRIQGVSLVYLMSGSGALGSVFALGMLQGVPVSMAAPAAYMVKIFAMSFFVFTVAYTAAAFPTHVRQTAVGFCTAAGRLGSISAPLVFELSKSFTGKFDFFIGCLIALLTSVAITAPIALPKWGCLDIQAEGFAESLSTDGKEGYGSTAKSCA